MSTTLQTVKDHTAVLSHKSAQPIALKATCHPISRLPLELLTHIFHLGTLDDPASFPLLVSHVAGSWRDLALAKTCLWTYINFSGHRPFDKAGLWLQRSQERPLTVALSVEEGFTDKLEQLEAAILFLKPEQYRWGKLILNLDPDTLRLALAMCVGPAPALTHLFIRCADQDIIDEQFALFDDQTPNLKSLHLEGIPFAWTGPLFRDLTNLDLRNYPEDIAPSVEQVIAVLQQSPRLKRLVFDRMMTIVKCPSIWESDILVLPEVQHIQMTDLDRDFTLWFVLCLLVPKAQTYIGDPEYHDPEFDEMVRTKGRGTPFPNIKRMRIQYTEAAEGPLEGMLRGMKYLTTIEFFRCKVLNNVLDTLLWTSNAPRATSLRELRFEACHGFTLDALRKVVISRFEDAEPIRSLTILGCSLRVEEGDLEWFQQNVARFQWKSQ